METKTMIEDNTPSRVSMQIANHIRRMVASPRRWESLKLVGGGTFRVFLSRSGLTLTPWKQQDV